MKLNNVIAKRPTKTIYEEDGKVIKLFNEEFKTSDILNEALNQSRVYEAGINVPMLYEVKKHEGKWAIVSEFIKGVTLETLINENPDKIDEYLELFTDVQISIHNNKAPLLNKLKDKMSRKIEETGLDPSIRYELHTRLEGMPKHNKVCHGDFNPGNVIVTEDNKIYVIDWAHVTQGNASADVARTYLLFSLEGKKDIAEKYLDMFSKKTDTAKQYIKKWIPIVAASQLSKGNEEERDFLLNWVDVIEFQ